MHESNNSGITDVTTLLRKAYGEGRESGPNVPCGKCALRAPVV